jgi:hypothetical protein
MSNTIQIKRSSTAASVPTAGQLAVGELAVNLADKKLFTKDASNAVVELGGAGVALTGDQTIAGVKTFSSSPVVPDATTATQALAFGQVSTANAAPVKTALNASGDAPIYACRAWVNFNGTGTVAINASGNVSSITDNGTGNYTVNFTTAMPDENYTFAGSGTRSATDQNPRVLTRLSTQTKTPTAIQLINMESGTTLARDEAEVTVVFLR